MDVLFASDASDEGRAAALAALAAAQELERRARQAAAASAAAAAAATAAAEVAAAAVAAAAAMAARIAAAVAAALDRSAVAAAAGGQQQLPRGGSTLRWRKKEWPAALAVPEVVPGRWLMVRPAPALAWPALVAAAARARPFAWLFHFGTPPPLRPLHTPTLSFCKQVGSVDVRCDAMNLPLNLCRAWWPNLPSLLTLRVDAFVNGALVGAGGARAAAAARRRLGD